MVQTKTGVQLTDEVAVDLISASEVTFRLADRHGEQAIAGLARELAEKHPVINTRLLGAIEAELADPKSLLYRQFAEAGEAHREAEVIIKAALGGDPTKLAQLKSDPMSPAVATILCSPADLLEGLRYDVQKGTNPQWLVNLPKTFPTSVEQLQARVQKLRN